MAERLTHLNPQFKLVVKDGLPGVRKNSFHGNSLPVIKRGLSSAQKKWARDKSVKRFSKKFLKTTSLSVLDIICSSDYPIFLRYVYIIVLTAVISLSSFYTIELYRKWSNSPVLLTESGKDAPITSSAFPAITICNLNRARRSVAETIKPHTWDFIRLKTLCNVDTDLSGINETSATEWNRFRKFIINVTQSCSEIILFCRYGSILQNCSDIFETVLTDQGVCCTFNGLHPDYIYMSDSKDRILDIDRNFSSRDPVFFTSETGYEQPLPNDFYPRKSVGVGIPMGFSVILNASLNEYFCSSSRSSGFKILVHTSTEVARVSDYANLVPTNHETRFLIKPSYQTTSELVRSVRISDRHCLFNSESHLKYFRVYSSGNCELECTADIMAKECGCVLVYLPRRSNKTIICGLKDMACSQRVEMESLDLTNPKGKCKNCIFSCAFHEYRITSTQAPLLKRAPMLDEFLPTGYNVSELAVVHFFHQHATMRVSKLEAYLKFIDFFSNSGGIYSLFLGFSILSLIELLYFLTIIAGKFIQRRNGKHVRTGKMLQTYKLKDKNTVKK